MPAERLKFRCYRCNQLLAVVAGKAGSIVACPKCSADLVVPQPESTAPVTAEAGEVRAAATGGQPGFLQNVDSEIPADLAELRPEDLRVEAEFFANLSHSSPTAATTTTTILEAESTYEAPAVPRGAPPQPVVAASRVDPASFNPREVERAPALRPSTVQASSTILVSEPIVPPIDIESPALRAPVNAPRVVREVVLPASVVLAWSLFVLIAIALAFVAGLMVGHFLWKPM